MELVLRSTPALSRLREPTDSAEEQRLPGHQMRHVDAELWPAEWPRTRHMLSGQWWWAGASCRSHVHTTSPETSHWGKKAVLPTQMAVEAA